MNREDLPDGWKLVKFGDVVRKVSDRVDPESSGIDRYVAGEHMETDELRIRTWGEVGDGYLGPAFQMRFVPGQVLYGSRRTYLRKVAVADFEGICANTTFVLESDSSELLPEFLPHVMTTELFHEHSMKQSKGSVNPYINFSDLTWYEFALPAIGEQSKIAETLGALDEVKIALQRTEATLSRAESALLESISGTEVTLENLIDADHKLAYGVLKPDLGRRDETAMVRIQDLVTTQLEIVDSMSRITVALSDEFVRTKLQYGDVLISVVGSIGRTAVAGYSLEGSNVSRAIAVARPKRNIDPFLLASILASRTAQSWMESKSSGGVQKVLNLGALRKIPLVWPSEEEGIEILKKLKAFRQVQALVKLRLESTNELRGALLNAWLGAGIV